MLDRMTEVLADRRLQQTMLASLRYLMPDIERVQRLRRAVPYATADSEREPAAAMLDPSPIHSPEFEAWVKDALSHYWGGPKLTRSPLIKLRVVSDTLSQADDDPTKALRLVLGQAIERLRPDGKQNFTAPEWLLYNILELRFIQGRKVREIADRLAVSESDLYRKQRVAIGHLARVLSEMEQENGVTLETTPQSVSLNGHPAKLTAPNPTLIRQTQWDAHALLLPDAAGPTAPCFGQHQIWNTNLFVRSRAMRYAKQVFVSVVMLLTLFVLAGCITVNTGIPATPAPQSPTQFNTNLVAALVNRDFDSLQGMMGNPFVLALWQSEGQALEPEAAIAVMAESYFLPDASLTFVSSEIVDRWMGEADPLAIWPPETTPVSALGVTGLGESGAGQAVLIVAENGDGHYYWYAMLLAPEGFDASGEVSAPDIIVISQPTPVSLLPTEVQQVLIVGPVGIFEGPGSTYQLIDTAVRGQTFPVLGASVDGQWWAVVCPGSTATCWITANPTFVQPVAVTKPTATPTWRPPRPTPTPRPIPPTPTPPYIQRIQFAPGQDTAVVSGNASQFQNPQYVLFAYSGQRLRILIGSTPSGTANFSVRGESDGKIYKAINDPNREWSLTLPRTQDYRISVAAAVAAYYQMEVSVTGALPPTPTPPAAPERIQFAPGQDTAVRSAPLPANMPKQYIFRALAGQTARILLESPSSGANFAVQGVADGVPYKTFDNPAREWSLLLPRTQDYLITILAPCQQFVHNGIDRRLRSTNTVADTRTHFIPSGEQTVQFAAAPFNQIERRSTSSEHWPANKRASC